VGVDQDVDIRTRRLTDQRGELCGFALILSGHGAVKIAVSLFSRVTIGDASLLGERIELQSGVTRIDDVADFADDGLSAGKLRLIGMGVERDLVSYRAPEKLVDRLADDFPADIP
jgi:hypothetical protein